MDFPRDFGPYRLLKQIAMGGMAEIVLAKTTGFGGFEKLLALKMIHPKYSADEHFINMLIEEAKICVELEHINIGQVFDLGKLGEIYFISMEYIEGADIFNLMRRATDIDFEIPIETCAHIGQEISAGLDYAHNRRDAEGRPLRIIHRDISPQNVLISYAGEVKIVDFGIAKAGLRAQETEIGVIKGKYYYMSPEQAWGDPIDHRTDIFSAGIIVYEMLTGQMLYLEENIEILLDRVRKADIDPPSSLRREIPAELDDIVMKALAKDPDDRFQSAHEMGQALRSFLYTYSPDYTPARLASMLGWLLDEDAHLPEPVSSKPADSSLLLTREDLSRQLSHPKATGSLLHDLADLQQTAGALLDESTGNTSPTIDTAGLEPDGVDDDPTSQIQLPDMMLDFSLEPQTDTGSNDATMRVNVPLDLAPFSPDNQWEEGSVDQTLVETSAELLQQVRDKVADKSNSTRQAHEVTRQIDTGEITNNSPPPAGAPSYLPPPPPPGGSGRPSYRPPAPPGGSREPQKQPPQPERSAPEPKAPPKPKRPSAPPKPKRPSAPPKPKRPSAPPKPKRPSAPPKPKRPAPETKQRPSAPPFELPSPPVGPKPPTLEPEPPRREPHPHQPAAPPIEDQGGTKPTALIPAALQLDPKVHEETGPTTVAPRSSPPKERPRPNDAHPQFEESGEQTQPTSVLSRPAEPTSQAPPPQQHQQPPAQPQPSPRNAQAPRNTQAPRNDPPPWLIGNDGFTPRPSPPAEPEPAENDPLSDAALIDDSEVLRPGGSPFQRYRKYLLPAAIAVVVILAGVVLWPRPPEMSTLEIRSLPQGAKIILDGTPYPTPTPTKIAELEQGTVHQLEVRHEGYVPWSRPVVLNAPDVRKIAVLPPIRGTLRVTSSPRGASVIVDGIYRGSTPIEVDDLDINRDVDVQVRYEDQTKTHRLTWEGRTEASISVTFDPPEERRSRRRR